MTNNTTKYTLTAEQRDGLMGLISHYIAHETLNAARKAYNILDQLSTNPEINQLFKMLKDKGGAIVSSNEAHEIEIAEARVTGRFSVDDDGFGFIWRYPEWLKKVSGKESLPAEPADKYAPDLKGHKFDTSKYVPLGIHESEKVAPVAGEVAEAYKYITEYYKSGFGEHRRNSAQALQKALVYARKHLDLGWYDESSKKLKNHIDHVLSAYENPTTPEAAGEKND